MGFRLTPRSMTLDDLIIIIIIIIAMDFFWLNLECCRVARVSQPQLSFLVTLDIMRKFEAVAFQEK